jgi:protein tyrosine phosphatase
MILEQNVTLILGLCNLKEQGRTKCHKYWPDADKKDLNKYLSSEIKVLNSNKEKVLGKTLIERSFDASSTILDRKL